MKKPKYKIGDVVILKPTGTIGAWMVKVSGAQYYNGVWLYYYKRDRFEGMGFVAEEVYKKL